MTRDPRCTRRAAELAALYRCIERTRMAGLPLLHPGLRVEAVGFAPAEEGAAIGVLLTPWFMNLVWLPLEPLQSAAGVGRATLHSIGPERFDLIGAYEPGFGAFSACSLYSPMGDFVDQVAAVATAKAVLVALREPPAATLDRLPTASAMPASARRAFLFGRRSGPVAHVDAAAQRAGDRP